MAAPDPRYRGRMAKRPRFEYSRWDGSQVGFELDAYDVFEEITDDLLYHGDLNAALRRMMQSGFEDRNGEQLKGLREMLEELRRRRREQLEQYDLGGVYDDIAQELRDVVDLERGSLDEMGAEARESGDARRQEITEEVVQERQMQLDMLSPDLAGMVRDLQDYEFTSSEAREKFEELLDQLRQQLMQSYVNQMSGAMSNVSPEQMQRMKDMMSELNQMLEQHQRGEEPDFDGFMERYGDFFPENPQNVDELLEVMAQRMAAMQAMMNSMTPEQRAQLQGLSEQLLEDMDLRWQVDQLSSNLQSMFPDLGWNRRYDFSGQDPLSFGEAAQMLQELGDIDQLENLLRGATSPGALAEVDIDRATRSARRRVGPKPRADGRAGQDARRGRPDREQGRALRAHAARHPPDRSERVERSVQEARGRQDGSPRARTQRRRATSATSTPSPTSSAIRSTSTSSARSATPSAARAEARRCGCYRTTSRSSAPSRWCGRAPCSCSTCRCRCRCATTSCPPRRSRWRCTR